MKWIKIKNKNDLPPFNMQVMIINKWYDEPYTAILVKDDLKDFDKFRAYNPAIGGYDLDPDEHHATYGDITHWAEIELPKEE